MIRFGLYKPDRWSICHIVLTFVLCSLLGIWIGLLLMIAYEIFEAFFGWQIDWKFPGSNLRIFDSRGGDIGDIICDAVGFLIAVAIQ